MKKLMIAVLAGVAMAASAAEVKDYQVYNFQQTGKVFDAATGKTVTEKVTGLAVYAADEQVFACTWGKKKDTKFTSGAKNGKKAYAGKLAEVTFFTDPQVNGKKMAYGYKFDANAGYGTGTEKSVKGNFVGDKVFGTWQLKFDSSSTKKFANGKFADINALLEAKNVEVMQ